MPKLVKVKPENENKLFLCYSDGTEGIYDVDHLKSKEEFRPIFIDKEFSNVFIDASTNEIAWKCGIRLCQNSVYKQLHLKSLMGRLHIDLDKL